MESIKPTSRRLRRHYGFRMARLFRDNDPISNRYWDDWIEEYYCKDVMTWQFDKARHSPMLVTPIKCLPRITSDHDYMYRPTRCLSHIPDILL